MIFGGELRPTDVSITADKLTELIDFAEPLGPRVVVGLRRRSGEILGRPSDGIGVGSSAEPTATPALRHTDSICAHLACRGGRVSSPTPSGLPA